MGHSVFISYSSADRDIADKVCTALEEANIKCWMAPRDIISGENWPEAIASAIQGSTVLLVVFSGSTNQSKHVVNELTMAQNKGIKVVPLKIEEAEPDGALKFYLTGAQWLEVKTPLAGRDLQRLVEAVASYLELEVAVKKETEQKVVKKSKWPNLIFALLLLSIFILSATIYFYDIPVPLSTILVEDSTGDTAEDWHLQGNSTGNIANLGLVAAQDGWVYFSNVGNGYYLCRMPKEGGACERLNEDRSLYINIAGDWIYYVNASDYDRVYRIKADGSEKEPVSNHTAGNLQVAGNWAYYSNYSDGGHGHVHRVNLDDGEQQYFFKYTAGDLNFLPDQMYYIHREKGMSIWCYSPDGSSESIMNLDRAVSLLVYEDLLYYISEAKGGELARLKVGSQDPESLTDEPVKFINMDEHYVYYIRADEGVKIHKVGHDREKSEAIDLPSDHYAICLNIADGWIYYIDRGSKREQLYRIAVEGGYPELVGGDGDES